jgi:hypothetical protein
MPDHENGESLILKSGFRAGIHASAQEPSKKFNTDAQLLVKIDSLTVLFFHYINRLGCLPEWGISRYSLFGENQFNWVVNLNH